MLNMKPFNSLVWVILLLALSICASPGQEAPKPKVIDAASDGMEGTRAVALRNRLTVTVTNLSSLLAQAKAAKKPVVLYLNGIALKGIEPEATDANKNQLRFHLVRSEESRRAWAALLGDPRCEKKVSLSVGLEGEG